MGRLTARRKVIRVDLATGSTSRSETAAVEEPLELRVDDAVLTVTMRTPGHDVELAHGLLRSEGVISDPDDVIAARYCTDTETLNVLQVQLRTTAKTLPVSAQRSLASYGGCGLCGKSSIDAVTGSAAFTRQAIVSEPATTFDVQRVAELPQLLRAGQPVFDRTGGTHAAGLFGRSGDAIVIREDIGRHNAVDKVTGWALMNRQATDETILMVSSRASFEIVQKAAMAGIPVLACVSAPSSLAIDAAAEFGMTLVAFVRGTRMTVCTHPERLGLTFGA
ncbi:formate dehydrogenase accessory sulfurtransferase FdhD [Rudaeicoccus suwonensis]|uniref:Sulfur carrier protein FdhD n=1 Tax=Rudaeicoccus suwonensis TaxID=657409 RepID=A0A561EB51_9MICO|nr:formate dehydrogenase accessory sulfurtransferase FdhD [Rudaeicoccus suwonensis]TWE12854.1 FdhD protein [Rudaeicoccus suwonensis]